jgi:polyphosphate kinase
MVDSIKDFPYLKDHSIYLAVLLSDSRKEHKPKYSLIEIPTETIPRFLVLPRDGVKSYVILLDDVIRYCLDDIFYIFPHDNFQAWTVKLTRDAELDLLDDFNSSVIEKMEKGLKQRRKGKPVRFIYDAAINSEMLAYFLERMHLKKGDDNLVAGARYHNFKDFMGFPSLGKTHLLYPSIERLQHPDLPPNRSILHSIAQKDVLLHYPYHSFEHTIDFLREAAIDPKVQEIKITLYRLAKNSKVANTLINAVRNGKKVIVVMELLARFDEEHNIYWSDRLREEGAQVIFGIQGLKVHCKVCLIKRREKGATKLYANVSTGNYNESTAKIYADHALFTADERITGELEQMFDFFVNTYRVPDYKHLLMSPVTMRKRLEKMIQRETEVALRGRKARIDIKLNNVADTQMIMSLVEAAKAGVQVRMLVRGSCTFAPQSDEVRRNLEIRSIVDKFLEHSRILIFHGEGEENVYLTSADWMIRNLDSRVEMAFPVFDFPIKQELKDYFEIQWRDNQKSRIIDIELRNEYYHNGSDSCRSQEEIYAYLKKRYEDSRRALTAVQPSPEPDRSIAATS